MNKKTNYRRHHHSRTRVRIGKTDVCPPRNKAPSVDVEKKGWYYERRVMQERPTNVADEYAFVVTRKAARVRHCCRPNTQHHTDQRDVISDHRVYMYMYMYMYMYIVFWKFVSLRKRLSKLFIGDNSRENEREREWFARWKRKRGGSGWIRHTI